MIRKLQIIIFIISLFVAPLAYSTEYYVRTDGNDSNDGSANDSGNAWLTIAYAESQVSAEDTVNIATGTYTEQVTIDVNGGSGTEITFIGTGTVSIQQIKLTGDYITLNNLTISHNAVASPWNDVLLISGDNNLVTNCIIDAQSTTTLAGLSVYGNDNLITGSTVKNVTDAWSVSMGELSATTPGSSGNTFTEGVVQDCDSSDAFRVHGEDMTISYNEIKDFVYPEEGNHPDFVQWFPNDNDCANSYDIKNILIEGNYIHDAKMQLWYGNNVCHASGAVVDGITFRNNVFYKVAFHSQDYGNPSSNLKIYNNTFHTCACEYWLYTGQQAYNTHVISIGSNWTGAEVKNNIFINSGAASGGTCDSPVYTADQGFYSLDSGVDRSNNYVSAGATGYTAKTGFTESSPSINGGDPKFTDESGLDFSLQSDSPLIDQATTIATFSDDKDENTRSGSWDIGAYEFQSGNQIMCSGTWNQ